MSPLELFTQAWMTCAVARSGIEMISAKPRKIDATATAVRFNDIRNSS
jgi:hypothetical protein